MGFIVELGKESEMKFAGVCRLLLQGLSVQDHSSHNKHFNFLQKYASLTNYP